MAVEGASAAGKTTALTTLAGSTGWTVLPEAYRRLVPTPSLTFDAPGELVALEERLLAEDSRRYVEARARERAGETVIADTGFLGPLTYPWALVELGAVPASVLDPLRALARRIADRGEWGLADAYIYLDTPASVRTGRAATDPTGHPAPLAPRHRAVGELERRFYRERFAPGFGQRFRWVPGDGPATLVAGRVVEAVRRALEGPRGGASVDAVLALFAASGGPPPPSRGNR